MNLSDDHLIHLWNKAVDADIDSPMSHTLRRFLALVAEEAPPKNP